MNRCTVHIGFILGICLLLTWGNAQGDPLPIQYDSTRIDVRAFSEEALDTYRDNPDFQYESVEIELNWLERLLRSINRFFSARTKGGQIFWEIVIYLLAAIALGIIIFGILKLQPGRFFGRGKNAKTQLQFDELDEDIHEMDFDSLIEQAIQTGSFRRGVRLLYLETLKELTENEWIDWRKHKTNQDYQLELADTGIRPAFDDLTLRYEYVWYGDFPIDQQGFQAMESIFRRFQQGVRNRS